MGAMMNSFSDLTISLCYCLPPNNPFPDAKWGLNITVSELSSRFSWLGRQKEIKKSTRHTQNTLLPYWLEENNHSKNPAGIRATTERLAWTRAFCQLKRPLAPCSRPIKVCIHVCLSTVLDSRFDVVPVNYTVINTALCFSPSWDWRIGNDWRETDD